MLKAEILTDIVYCTMQGEGNRSCGLLVVSNFDVASSACILLSFSYRSDSELKNASVVGLVQPRLKGNLDLKAVG
jgi:hypothetical protein